MRSARKRVSRNMPGAKPAGRRFVFAFDDTFISILLGICAVILLVVVIVHEYRVERTPAGPSGATAAPASTVTIPNPSLSVTIGRPNAPHPPSAQLTKTQQETALVLWDGEDDAMRNAGLHNAQLSYMVHHSGTTALLIQPTRWDIASLNMANLPAYRQDLSRYDELRFFVRAEGLRTSPAVNISFYTFNPVSMESERIDIGKYIVGGGKLGKLGQDADGTSGEWQEIAIPLADMMRPGYDLSEAEFIQFSMSPGDVDANAKIYVDDLEVVKTQSTYVTNFIPLSDNVVKIVVKDKYDMDSVLNVDNYQITSDRSDPVGLGSPDADFKSPVHPMKIGRLHHITGFDKSNQTVMLGNPLAPLEEYDLFLVFDKNAGKYFKQGMTYELQINTIKDFAGNDFSQPQSITFTYDEHKLVSTSVQANQVGYLPDSPKFAYAGNYLGDIGPMDISPAACEIRDARTDSLVLNMPMRLRGQDPNLSGEIVYDCDFSNLTATGQYYVLVPGLGRTYNFAIDPHVYDDVAYKTARLFYYQRDGIALDAAHAGNWSRGAGHLDTDAVARIHESQRQSPLYDDEVIGSTLNETRGWYDAGDMGKYVLTAGPTLWHFFTAYEMFPEKFHDNQWNIPESGNGIPDILDETKWEVDWLRNMQAPDGGVFERVTTHQWAGTMPEFDNTQPRDISEKTTYATTVYAATLAMAYREFKGNAAFERTYPGYADDLLARAKKAWAFLEKHPDSLPASGGPRLDLGIGGGTYVDVDGDIDGRAWAAAELYKSTGDQQYNDAFAKYWVQHDPLYGYNDFQHHQLKASLAYAMTTQMTGYPVNQQFVDSYKTALRQKLLAQDTLSVLYNTEHNVYRDGYRSDVPAYIGWGSFAKSSQYAWELIKDAYILNDSSLTTRLLADAKINLDVQLGNNPQYMSYITGVGTVYPRDPLQTISLLDNVTEPVPGIPVYGPVSGMSDANIASSTVHSTKYLYPAGHEGTDPYPLLRRYFDVNEVVEMSEFAIGDSVQGAMAFAYFSNMS